MFALRPSPFTLSFSLVGDRPGVSEWYEKQVRYTVDRGLTFHCQSYPLFPEMRCCVSENEGDEVFRLKLPSLGPED